MIKATLPSTTSLLLCCSVCYGYAFLVLIHSPSIFIPAGKIFQTELFWSPVQSKSQIIRGLTGRPIPTDPAPSFPELPLRISTVYSPSAFQRGGRGGVCAIQRRVIRKEKRRKYHPVAQISVRLPLLGVSATCCAQLAKHTAMRNSLGRNRLVYK